MKGNFVVINDFSIYNLILQVLQDKNDNGALESENQRLTELKNKMLAALRNIECIRCSGDLKKVDSETHQLQLENARLRAEVYISLCSIFTRVTITSI